MKSIDLNADVGEGAGFDEQLIPLVSSVNIACGAHAGDARSMAQAMALATAYGVVMGAHPGFADREHMGRREIEMGSDEIIALVSDQLAVLAKHGNFRYVKPHGGLYNLAARDVRVAKAVVKAVESFDRSLALMALAGSVLLEQGRSRGLRVVAEAFADRAYDCDGRLVSRSIEGAMIEDADAAVAQVLTLVAQGHVKALTGELVPVEAESICLHGDNPRAVAFARQLREKLENEKIQIRSFLA